MNTSVVLALLLAFVLVLTGGAPRPDYVPFVYTPVGYSSYVSPLYTSYVPYSYNYAAFGYPYVYPYVYI